MNNKLESIVGFIILMIAVGFMVLIQKHTAINNLKQTYVIRAKFDQVDGIVEGSDVRISGVKVGSVIKLNLDPKRYNAVMTIGINNSVKLPKDSSMKIMSSGLLGDRYVSIDIGSDDKNLSEGDEVQYTQSAINLESLISKTIFNANGNKEKNGS